MLRKGEISGWGNFPFVKSGTEELISWGSELSRASTVSFGVRGNGRSYGDSSNAEYVLNPAGIKHCQILDHEGVVICGAGLLISELLEIIVPKGYFIPVTPGTKYVTIGGAVAADIHGKNHHVDGNISFFIREITLFVNGEELTCSPHHKPDLFWATCGGMGLTGVILEARIQLKRIPSAYVEQRTLKAKDFDELVDLIEENSESTYSVAWIDCLKRGRAMGRGILLLGEHTSVVPIKQNRYRVHSNKKLNVPFYFPDFVLNSLSIKLFNFLYYHKQRQKEKKKIVHYEPFFYPLDKLRNWNRIYGKGGFVQYQFVLPPDNAREGMRQVLKKLSEFRCASFLAVLKTFGPKREQNYIAFPEKGLNLALDIKVTRKVLALLDELDQIVLKYGGRIYLAKDGRMSKDVFQSSYPQLESFKAVLNKYGVKNISTHQSERLGITSKVQSTQNHRSMKNILILGANSDIAQATALVYLQKGWTVTLASRNTDSLNEFTKSMSSPESIVVKPFDSTDSSSHENFYKSLDVKPDAVLLAFGVLPEDSKQLDHPETMNAVDVNYRGALSILSIIAKDFKNKKGGHLLIISSVAGDRGRGSNFLYGSTKAGLSVYASGLRNHLFKDGVHVCTIKPGFVQTKMLGDMKTPGPLTASPDQVAKRIYSAMLSRKSTLYVLPIWRLIMWVIRHIPEFIFKRMSL